jgi:hypothetical protein
VMDNRLLLYTCQRKQTEYKRRRRPTSWWFSLRDYPLRPETSGFTWKPRYHVTQSTDNILVGIFSSSVIRSPFHTKSNFKNLRKKKGEKPEKRILRVSTSGWATTRRRTCRRPY